MSRKMSMKKMMAIYNKNNSCCVMCNIKLQCEDHTKKDYFHIDHLVPKDKKGANNIENLFPICKSCNSSKRNKNHYEILEDTIYKIKDLKIDRLVNIINYENNYTNIDKRSAVNDLNTIMCLLNITKEKIGNIREVLKDEQ